MMDPVRPKILVTGILTAVGVIQVGVDPERVRTCPEVPPEISPMVLPTRERPLLKVKRSENCPVIEL